jgi:hypothetical protein
VERRIEGIRRVGARRSYMTAPVLSESPAPQKARGRITQVLCPASSIHEVPASTPQFKGIKLRIFADQKCPRAHNGRGRPRERGAAGALEGSQRDTTLSLLERTLRAELAGRSDLLASLQRRAEALARPSGGSRGAVFAAAPAAAAAPGGGAAGSMMARGEVRSAPSQAGRVGRMGAAASKASDGAAPAALRTAVLPLRPAAAARGPRHLPPRACRPPRRARVQRHQRRDAAAGHCRDASSPSTAPRRPPSYPAACQARHPRGAVGAAPQPGCHL